MTFSNHLYEQATLVEYWQPENTNLFNVPEWIITDLYGIIK